jgi:hypothetical protein
MPESSGAIFIYKITPCDKDLIYREGSKYGMKLTYLLRQRPEGVCPIKQCGCFIFVIIEMETIFFKLFDPEMP